MSEALFTIEELADRAGESRRTIERRISEGRIPVIRRSSRCIRIRESVANAYIYGEQNEAGEGGTVHPFPQPKEETA